MTLSELLANPVPPHQLQSLALVFQSDLRERLVSVQDQYGNPRFTAFPVELSNGTWMHQATILTECRPGGLYWGGFSRLDSLRFSEIAVVPYADAVALLPKPESP